MSRAEDIVSGPDSTLSYCSDWPEMADSVGTAVACHPRGGSTTATPTTEGTLSYRPVAKCISAVTGSSKKSVRSSRVENNRISRSSTSGARIQTGAHLVTKFFALLHDNAMKRLAGGLARRVLRRPHTAGKPAGQTTAH